MDVAVIIPAYNEEKSIQFVLADIPINLVKTVIVVDNNSIDNTARIAFENGATVIREKRKGYGWACLKGINYLKNTENSPDIIIFLDGDYSDYPENIKYLLKPIVEEDYDFVIGSRTTGKRDRQSMTLQQIFGNWLATKLIKLFYNAAFTDLGPLRAIKFNKLLDLDMQDKTYGWTVEMQIKAVKKGLKTCEIPVSYRKRIGISKVSGTLKGTIGAGYKILLIIFKYI